MDESRKRLAKKYEKIKLTISITEGILSFILLALFVVFGYSKKLEILVFQFTSNSYMALIYFGLIIGAVSSVLSFPVDYYFGFKLEHRFGLSNLTFIVWLKEKFKAALVGIVIGVPIVFLFYWLISSYENWWLYLAFIVLGYSVVLAQVAPVLILPVFYKIKPIENENLKEIITKLCGKAGFRTKGVFTFNMSRLTKKANAAFTGLGRTKRIILSDTLIEKFTGDEIESVFAHELGHYKKGHIKKSILYSVFSTFIGLFLISQIYGFLLPKFGYQNPWEIGALPLLALIASVLGFITGPLGSAISKKFEFEADRFAIDTVMNFASFKSAMEKLAEQNLADDEPNKLVEFWFHSHPSIKRRIQMAEQYYNHCLAVGSI
ncbi:MAG: M48 family metallopeptidase [Chlorobi bacterium]|nr:M48 family metallopeptidase [Chlorobiota bacterium]MCI0716680.1 M48 family metallopeptidase [Chlorobiota bacterium]